MAASGLAGLDAESLHCVLRRLRADDLGRLACVNRAMRHALTRSTRAEDLWRAQTEALLGRLAPGYISSTCLASPEAWAAIYRHARQADCLTLAEAQAPQPRALLARSAHTATLAGQRLVLLGGELAGAPSTAACSLAVLDRLGLLAPRMLGQAPPALRHHCTARVALQPGSPMADAVLLAVAEAQQAAGQAPTADAAAVLGGLALAVIGGLTPAGDELDSCLLLAWLSPDASWGCWLRLATQGPAPAPRAYACCQAVQGGSRLIVYGGWVSGSHSGTVAADVGVCDGYLLLCCHLLHVPSLTWVRQPTWPLNEPPRPGHAMLGPSTCPGPRKQALSAVRRCPGSGREQLLVLGGCGADGLADCVPYCLDLDAFTWTKGPTAGYLPAPRDAGCLLQLSREWLLLLGGQRRGEPLTGDVQRLHLPSLAWQPPPVVHEPGAAGSAAIDCAGAGCMLAGGSREGAFGRVIQARLVVLLPGPPLPPRPAAGAAGASASGSGSGGGRLFESRQVLAPQPGGVEQAGVPSCSCGSCCSCLAAKARACSQLPAAFDPGLGCCAVLPGPAWPQPSAGMGLGPQRSGLAPSSELEPEPCCPPTNGLGPDERRVAAWAAAQAQQQATAAEWQPGVRQQPAGDWSLGQLLLAALVLLLGLLLAGLAADPGLRPRPGLSEW